MVTGKWNVSYLQLYSPSIQNGGNMSKPFYLHGPALTGILLCGSNSNHTHKGNTLPDDRNWAALEEKDAFQVKFMDERKRAKESEKSSKIRKRRRGLKKTKKNKSKHPESGIIPSRDLGLFGDWLSSSLISWFVLNCWVLIKRGSYRITLERHDVCSCTCWRPHTHTSYISTCPGNTPVKPAGRIRGAERAESAHCSDKPRTHKDRQKPTQGNHQHRMDPEDRTKQQSKSFRLKEGRYVGRPTVNSMTEGL